MSGDRRAKYKPVQSLVAPERCMEPSGQPATAVSPTHKPSMDHAHALSLSECSSLSSFVTQDQLNSDPVLSSVVEPKEAITVSKTSPVKVVRHDINDSVQTRSSSGAMKVVQSSSTRAGQAIDVLNMDNESFHTPTPLSFDNSKFNDDDDNYRFTTNFVTPPLRRGQQLTAKPFEAQDAITVVKEKRANETSKSKQDDGSANVAAMPSLSDVTSATTVESQSSTSFTELASLMQSVSEELGQISLTATSKQEKTKKKKQKKGRVVVASRYKSSVKTKPVREPTIFKPSNTTTMSVVGRTGRRRGHSPNVRQQVMMDTTLPTPVTFNTAAMISSTPAVTDHEEERASHDIHDGSYISATNISATNTTSARVKEANRATSKKVTHHTRSGGEEAKQKREEFKSLRCCALQWAYLDAMTTKAVRQQEEQAISQIYQLHNSLINVMDQNKTLQNEIATIEHQMAVDDTLHSQLQGLGAVTCHLPEVESQYRKMAQSLDNTRHLMSTDGVVLPSEDDLSVTLQRSGQLMDKVLSLIDAPQIAELARSKQAVEGMKVTMNKAVESNEQLTQELQELQVEEASLRYHIKILEENYNVNSDN